MSSEPEQWAVALWHLAHRAYVMMGRNSHQEGVVDAALTIQRAFEDQTRKLREALKAVEDEGLRNHNTRCRPWWNQVRQALKETSNAQ